MEKQFKYTADIQQITLIQKDLNLLKTEWSLPGTEVRQILMVIEELFAGLIHNNFPEDISHQIEISIHKTENEINISISENGYPFNLILDKKREARDIVFNEPESMGVNLIRTFVESLIYKRESGKNKISFKKTIKSQSGRV